MFGVAGRALQNDAQSDDAIIVAGLRQLVRGRRHFKTAGHTENARPAQVRPGRGESVESSLHERVGQLGIVPGGRNAKPQAGRGDFSF